MKNEPFLILGGDSRLAKGFQKLYPSMTTLLSKNECNILDEKSIRKAFKKYTNKYVINCAAITDMSYCEENPKECIAINAFGPYLLNTISKEFNKKLIHISSDYASANSNIYGLSKYISEKMIDTEMLIIRTNFYDEKTFIVKELLENRTIETYTNIFFNPISINNLVTEIIAKKNTRGLINIFTDKKISFFTFASLVSSIFDKKISLIRKTSYQNNNANPYRLLSSYVKPDITVNIEDDLLAFKDYIRYANN
jgi:dTDP-4-dehydrorhamnose reductase